MPHSSASSSSRAASLGWLLLVGCSSLLLVEALSSAEQSCMAASAADGNAADSVTSATSGSIDYSVYDPPPPPHNSWQSNWDGLASVPPHTDPATGRPVHVTRHLLFIRHGQYVLPTKETAHLDPVLTTKGREQARLTGKRLASLEYPISTIHVSTMARAKETAELIGESFPGVPISASPLLSEGVPSAHYPQHPSWFPSEEDKATEPARISAGFERVVQRWREVEGQQVRTKEEYEAAVASSGSSKAKQAKGGAVIPPADAHNAAAGASGATQSAGLQSTGKGTISVSGDSSPSRSARSLQPLMVDRYELVVCHGNVIRYSLLRALQLPVQAWLRIAIWNTGISHIIIRPNGNVGLQTIGDTGHLPKDMITYH